VFKKKNHFQKMQTEGTQNFRAFLPLTQAAASRPVRLISEQEAVGIGGKFLFYSWVFRD
jgi:hypothetical protein